mmetsp:Transcript_16417/g.26988  ORF Transcript_16417/g.26988 Transcript_16417/m.26988 type:complete len:132 (+) Transcript_16417:1025-1420(+)
MTHFMAKVRMIFLEFDGISSETNNNSLHRALDDAEQHCRKHDSNKETNHEGSSDRVTETSQPLTIQSLQDNCEGPTEASNDKTNHGEDAGDEIIGYNSGPTTPIKQFIDLVARIFQTVMIESDIGESPGSK